MKKLLFLFISLIASLIVYADGVKFTASAPKAVVKGEQFRVAYTVTTQKIKDFRAPSFDGFEVLMGPSTSRSSSSSIDINGNMTSTSSFTYTYILMGIKEGNYTIPGATVVADGENKISNSLDIKVLPPDQTTGGGAQTGGRGQGHVSNASSSTGQISKSDLFITATVNKTNVYEQEAILLTYKVYFLVDLRELEIKMPDLKGFLTQEVDLQRGQPTLEHYNGRNYKTIVWSQYVLFPQQTGKLEIPSINFDATVAVRTQQHSMDPFDFFFNGGASYVDVRKTISTPKLTVNVSPLPGGKPESFGGGVGDFTIKSSVSATELKANDAVTLKVEIAGVGNMKLIDTPEVNFPKDFETYDPKVENDFKLTRNGLAGKKVIEYLAIPRYAGTYIIPEMEFSYFDIKSRGYKTLKTPSYQLIVEKGAGNDNQVVSNYSNKEEVKLLGQDIRYIKTGDFALRSKGSFFYGSLNYWLWYIIPFVLFVTMLILNRKKAKENANMIKVRTKNANRVAVKRMKVASKLLTEGKNEDFYDEVLKALWGYISDKLSIPVAQLSKDNIETELERYGVTDTLKKQFVGVLNDCEFARYAPTSDNKGMDITYAAALEVISEIENVVKR